MKPTALGAIVLCAILVVASTASAQQPRIVNGKMEARSAAAGLQGILLGMESSQVSPAWAGYSVPLVRGNRVGCGSNVYREGSDAGGARGRCMLESGYGVNLNPTDSAGARTANLEGPQHLLVLLRFEQKRLDRVRVFTEDCELDAGGLPLYWLNDVRAAESVAYLSSVALRDGSAEERENHAGSGALAAIALTDDPAAERALEGFVAPDQPEKLRGRTAFWLGAARGKSGAELLRRMAETDPSERVRDKVVFALYVSREPEALEKLLQMAHTDSSARVRGQALFWLAQKAGKKAAGIISDAIENDPDTQVKKRAVFALSQLPKEEGVPLLIRVARTNRNPAVRKQAMFWLGQSKDSRALAFFEEILTH